MFETTNDFIANKKNPAVKPVQMLAPLHHVFTPSDVSARTQIDKIADRRRDYQREFTPLRPGTLSVVHLIANASEVNR